MNRRRFIGFGIAGVGGAALAPKLALAGVSDSPMAGGVYYTAEAPGRWSKKVLSHLPQIEVAKQEQSTTVRVLTRHTMEKCDHYIVKHVVLDKDFTFVAEKRFKPLEDEEPLSEFVLGEYSGRIYVLSVCNQHDTWLNSADV
ncbi:MAG: desulfoferrodoxin family protein [Thiogranum sp.]